LNNNGNYPASLQVIIIDVNVFPHIVDSSVFDRTLLTSISPPD
jgi:hypothetical protein